ncbi:MAG: putative diacylglycerol O-acyltransferase [Accumulibacter sp.]|uniref:wax ester/triacylglycerol synthase family O-acyltransferase n=1 Tax=Accumulibacter sp. TaxID=2053492 RepID=UPI00120E0471|nr:wax ester/triacylglycerol synthase family O-acyltransferase [Accumulibacter sp.]TLD46277.1 MAG: putative diacylglycerol O-acyltransferase [Accumulibacter sp.]
MTARERVSSVDTAWLRMDRPENLMQILGIIVCSGRINDERLKRTVAGRLLRYRRFRQIITEDADGPCWVDDADFAIEAHVRRSLLPPPGGKHELQTFVAEMASTPLNPARPRWEFNVVDTADGNSTIVIRIHHAIADGIALIGVIDSLTDDRADAPTNGGQPATVPAERPAGRQRDASGDSGSGFWRAVIDPLADVAQASLSLGGNLWGQYQGLRRDPASLLDYASVVRAVAEEIGRLALMPDDTHTRFKGKAGTVKRVAWSEPLPLAEIKAVGQALSCSVNDLLLASVAGAMRSYLVNKGDAVEGVEIRAMVPVNLRQPGDSEELGNHFGLVALELPLASDNPLARLYATRARMAALKSSYQAMLTFALLGAAGMAPRFVEEQMLKLLTSKTTAVMTNVPGSPAARFLAGCRIEQQLAWVPQAGDIGIGVSILSYHGCVRFGLISDRNMVDDPQRITEQFGREFEKLLWLALLETPDRLADPLLVAHDVLTLSSMSRGHESA